MVSHEKPARLAMIMKKVIVGDVVNETYQSSACDLVNWKTRKDRVTRKTQDVILGKSVIRGYTFYIKNNASVASMVK